jgi:hypothetical protein
MALPRATLSLATLSVGLVACHNFDVFDPTDDPGALGSDATGGREETDGSTATEPGGDAASGSVFSDALPPGDAGACSLSCRTEATSCAGTCAQIQQSCVAVCASTDTACLQTCANGQTKCTAECVTECETCTSGAGCLDEPGCAAAAP